MSLYIVDSKICKAVQRETQPENICKISLGNNTFEKINLSCIFHDPLVKAALENTYAHFSTRTVVFALCNQ